MGLFDEIANSEVAEESTEEAVLEESAEATEEVAEEETAIEDGEEVEAEDQETIYEIDGEEVRAEDLNAWKESYKREQDGKTKQEDYDSMSKEMTEKSQKLDEYLTAFEGGESEIKSILLSELESDEELNELKANDYTEYLQARDRRDEKLKSFDSVKKKLASIRQEKLSEESNAIAEIRGWSTESKRNADLTLLNDFAKERGFTDADMKTLTSAKVLSVLISSAEQAQKSAEKSKARTKVIKPTIVKTGVKGSKSPAPKSLADKLFSDN